MMILFKDLKYALRLLSKKPGFTVLTTLVIAAGMGLSIYLFSFFNTMVFKDLPFQDGGSLIQISSSQNGQKNVGQLNLHDFNEIRTSVKGFSETGAFTSSEVNVTSRDGARSYNGIRAESNIFQLTRTKPEIGVGFSPLQDQQGAERVVVIGHSMWQNQFLGDREIVDKSVRINGQSHRIIGVMPKGYVFPNNAELWLPLRENVNQTPRDQASQVFGLAHLEQGAGSGDINPQLDGIMKRLEERYPDSNSGIGAYSASIPMAGDLDTLPFIFSMQVIAILVLILAAINVGNLLLSRAVERRKETAIRVALGAPRSRLISQMVWESIIICVLGGAIGFLFLAWGLDLTTGITKTFFPDKPPFWWNFGVDNYSVTLFVVFIIAAIAVTGLLPAWKNSGADFNAVLRDGTRGSLSKKSGRLNRVLIISEIFVSLTVLIAASVMMVGNYQASRADYGANTDNVLTARISLSGENYETDEAKATFISALQARLESTFGIGDVAISSAVPGAYADTPSIAVEGKEYSEQAGYPKANYVSVTQGSLAKLGVELKMGRYFDASDKGLDKGTVVITDSFAEREFSGESPIGKRIRNVEADAGDPNWLTIVGVVKHTIQGASYGASGKLPSVFRPLSQSPGPQLTIAMKMRSEPTVVTRILRKTLESIDPELPAFKIEPYTQILKRHTSPMIFITTLLLLFGLAAAILAASGIYGVMANIISQRTQEIGVKRALGANDSIVMKEFLLSSSKQLLWGCIPGVIVGCLLGFALSQMVGVGSGSLIFLSLLLVILVSGAVMLATYIPTKRALSMEPSQALRHE